MAHKICGCDTDATLFSFGGKLFFLQNQYNTQKHSLLQSISYNHIYCSLIPQVAFASIGSANPRSLQAGAKIGQMEDLLYLIFYLECAHQIAISAGGRSRS